MSTPAPASEAELVGQVLGNWRVIRPLARGGFGVVYEAHHVSLAGHRAAVKVLHASHAGDPEIQRRFTSEANAASRIAHPNIVKIFDAGTTAQGTCFIAMEFLDGQPLSALVKQGPLAARRVAHLLGQVASAVGAAHTRGIIHRDLKPDNILVVKVPGATAKSDELVKVLDFGIAKLANETGRTQTGALLGTPYYMSPEQWMADKNLDGRSDVYSLGIILYECLTGALPFEAATPLQYMYAHMQKPMPDLGRPGEYPEALQKLVRDMTHKKPAERPATMQQVEGALRAVAQSMSSPDPAAVDALGATLPIPGSAPAASQPKKGPRAAVALAALAGLSLALALVVVAARWLGHDRGAAPPKALAAAGAPPAASLPDLGGPPWPAELVVLGPSRFALGYGPPGAEDGPAHSVELARFALSRFEVSFSALAEYQAATAQVLTALQGVNLTKFGNRPAVNLPRDQAAAYCRWRFARWNGRLPTEAEWEFAARSGDSKHLFPWSKPQFEPGLANLGAVPPRTFPVESFESGASAQGILHLIGNAAEWTSTDAAPYPGSTARIASGLAVVRGGGANLQPGKVRATTRWFIAPTSGSPFLGFRCAATPLP